MKKLGLDLGSSSIGWALREENEISKKGVITFQSGMVKGQGGYSSPTKDRRDARSKRRLIQARKYRKWELLKIILDVYTPIGENELESWSKYKKGEVRKFPENEKFLKWLACDFAYLENGVKYNNPYELRVRAIDHKLSNHEFGRALYHLVQRRGYKDIGERDSETQKQIDRRGESGFQTALDNNRTIAEALTNNFLNKNKRARNQYPYRDEYRKELELICQGQQYDISKNEKGDYNNDLVQKLWKAIIWQRPLRSQKGNIGKCTLEPTKPRSPISHPVFEIFRAWSFINTIKYINDTGEKQSIPPDYRDLLFEQLFLKKDKNFKFEEIRKFLDKNFKSKKEYNYPINKKTGFYDSTVAGMPVCNGLMKVLGDDLKGAISTIHNYNISNAPKIIQGYSIYDLWHIIFEFDEKHLENFAIEKLKIENEKTKKGEEYNPFAKLKNNFLSGYCDLSLKAMVKITPFLKDGFLFNESAALAKIPELLGTKWEQNRAKIKDIIKNSNKIYRWHKMIVGITNNLIDQYKGLEYPNIYAHKDFHYDLGSEHNFEIEKNCANYFGEKSWGNIADKEKIILDVKKEYQAFFQDEKRTYREMPTLTDIFKEQLRENKIVLNGNLYHHSNRQNLYGKTVKDKKTDIEILPQPRIDSIKNPMFNKSMGILRKLINELIINGTIDKDTEVVVEVARELNDNNKRVAIERFQKEREAKRDKYREFLSEFKDQKNNSLNIEESIPVFELWTEQTFDQTENEKKEKIINKNSNEIHKEKEAIKRYELWMEQKGQCIYTGKMISITHLFSNEIDIEHTIPRSLFPDNTMANQTVCYARYNRDIKKNRMPYYCENYSEDKQGIGTKILPRLNNWIQTRDNYKEQYEKRIKPFGNEDEAKKNKRIQEKHYYKMHYDYWNDKVDRFFVNEIKDSWIRRQLTDTQMISKYAREFLKTYFKKVAVQKGSVTADFRKIYSFQEVEEIKNRNKHTHHSIDAAVLTLIPTNSSHKERLLKTMYETYENEKRQYTTSPFPGFNSQKLIQNIENNTLIVNYENDKILKQTYKNVRKRGRLQYLKNKKGKFILDKDGDKIILKAKGDTVRSTLFKDTFLSKIRDVERYSDGQPMREDGDWKYKQGKNEFIYTVRKPIKDALANIDNIIDPNIRELVRKQKNNSAIKDHQGNIIRHVRIKVKDGQKVKERINYRSKHDYKNHYYSAAGSLPYAILLQRVNNGNIEREMIPVASFKVAKMHKESGGFDANQFVIQYYPDLINFDDKKLLKVGQKVFVLNSDEEYKKRFDVDFQTKRLYVITQFSEGSIWLKYHLEAQAGGDIDDAIKNEKDKLIRKYEIQHEIPEVVEDSSIEDKNERKDDYEKRKYSFAQLDSFRFKMLIDKIGIDEMKKIKKELDKFKTQSSFIEVEGKTPLLKMSQESWNFLYEGYDFNISILGEINGLSK